MWYEVQPLSCLVLLGNACYAAAVHLSRAVPCRLFNKVPVLRCSSMATVWLDMLKRLAI